jgi:regulator of protease activity HflC (stomatin/prohibitin superfamily)
MGPLFLVVVGIIVGAALAGNVRRGAALPVVVIALVVMVLIVVLSMVRIVPAGHVGVVDFFGRVSPRALQSGINFVNPLARVIPMSVRTQEDMETMNVPSKEGLNVALNISVLYRLDAAKAVDVYKTIGIDYKDVILIPQYRAAARGVTVAHEAKALYTSEREALAQAIYESLKGLIGDRGVVIERVLLRQIALPETVAAAIEQKVRAEQEAERMKFVLQKETQEAQRKRIEAEGIRDAQDIIAQSLTTQYLHYLWVNTLNQNPNVIYVATEANMPIFRTAISDDELARRKPIPPKPPK